MVYATQGVVAQRVKFCLAEVFCDKVLSDTFSRLYQIDIITKTRLFKYTEKNYHQKMKNPDIFHTSTQNIDCGYSLETPHRGDSNEYP